jgi:hypothetical protein
VFVFVLMVVAVVGSWLFLRRRPGVQLWWMSTVGAWRAWISRALGSSPTFGSVQRAVLAEVIRQRTVSVTGSVWLPTALVVDLAPEDHGVIAHAEGPFLTDLAEALTGLAGTHGWRLDGPLTLRFAEEPSAAPGRPRVTVLSLSGYSAAGAAAAHQAAAPAPPPAPPSGPRPPTPPPDLPPTTRFADPDSPLLGTATVPPTVADTAGPPPAPALLLDPEHDGAPIVLGAGDSSTVIGRVSPADVLVSDPTVSGQHCRIVRSGAGWVIEDLGSSNGTILNGERIAGRQPLAPGDVVGLGRQAQYRVHL